MELSSSFQSLFPYDSPRESQADGIQSIDTAIQNNGIVTMEGACGTGKTLAALTPSIHNIRSKDTDANQIVAVTKVKQQMVAFQEEVKRINNQLPDNVNPISAITLVGVSDLHPFVSNNIIDSEYDSINELREGTRTLVNEDIYDYTYHKLYQRALDSSAGKEYPYGKSVPSADGVEYDPYYAKYRSEMEDIDEDETEEIIPFDSESIGVITVKDLREICGQRGLCPHSIMRQSIEHMEVIIGNYTHIFDPKTVNRISYPMIGDETIAIFDEAHNLVEKVRGFLSDEIPMTSINRAQQELLEIYVLARLSKIDDVDIDAIQSSVLRDETSEFLKDYDGLINKLEDVVTSSATITSGEESMTEKAEYVSHALSEFNISPDSIMSYIEFLGDLEETVSREISRNMPLSDGDIIPLRDPEEPDIDKISNWILLSEYNNVVKSGEEIGQACLMIRDQLSSDSKSPKTVSGKVGSVLYSWYNNDNIRYFRSIEFEERKKTSSYGIHKWQDNLIGNLTINNCIPRGEISEKLDTFHSSVLMSATLDPLDIYHQTTGIKDLESDGRDVFECRYGLAFPDENRVTIGVPADRFKYDNRGEAFDSFGPKTDNKTREEYRDVVFDIINKSNGNSLIVMPSYKEAEWIGSLLEQSYLCDAEDVYIDKSSSNKETQEMKEKFFNSDEGIMVTGARGTLIEGIDYIGDRLSNVVICGVPITNTNSDYKRAIQAAYDEIFDDYNGFDLAFVIPAVWKARQAIGRVIRTNEDKGVRAFVDKRYVDGDLWDSVYEYLGTDEQDEMEYIPSEDVGLRVETFWDQWD